MDHCKGLLEDERKRSSKQVHTENVLKIVDEKVRQLMTMGK